MIERDNKKFCLEVIMKRDANTFYEIASLFLQPETKIMANSCRGYSRIVSSQSSGDFFNRKIQT